VFEGELKRVGIDRLMTTRKQATTKSKKSRQSVWLAVSMTASMMSTADIQLQEDSSSFSAWGSEKSAAMSLSNSLSCALENSMKLWQVRHST